MMAGDFVDLPPLDENLFDEKAIPKNLALYQKKDGRVKWYFCQVCGCHIVQSAPNEEDSSKRTWSFSTGVLYPLALDDGTVTTKLVKHMYVKHGLDQGGMSQWLPDNLPRYTDLSITLASKDPKPTEEEQRLIDSAIKATTMPLRCHCGHVHLEVHRPSYRPLSEVRKKVAINDAWLWTFCLCDSCRTTSGQDANALMFIPYTHITSRSNKHPTDDLSVYSSYPGRRRHFCPTCGASIFFDRSDRGDLCDTFLGVVDIPLAAMISSWIHKAKGLSYHYFAKNKELADCLAEGFCPGVDLSLSDKEIEESAKYDGTLQE
jgi:hypothetical protein